MIVNYDCQTFIAQARCYKCFQTPAVAAEVFPDENCI